MRHTPLIYQHERSECGLACLAMVAGHYVRGVDLVDVRRLAGHGQRGHSLQQLLQLAEQMGFTARGLKLEPEQLPQLRQPSILHWDLDHFVVLIKATRRRVVVHDPAAGRRVYTWAQLAQHFTGVALELWPGADELVQPGQARLSLGEVWRMARGGAQSLGLLVVLSVLLQVLLLAGPWHLQWTIDAAIASGDANLVTVLAVGFAVLLVLRTLVTWLRALVVINLGYGLSFVFAARLLRHLLHLPLTWFGQRSVGDIAARFASLQPLRDFFTQGAANLLVDAVIVLLSLAAMLLYAPQLGLLVLAVQTVHVVIYGLCIGRMQQHSLAAVVAQGKEHAHLVESIRAVHSIKVYGQQGQRYAAWQKLYGATLTASRQVQVMQAALLTLATACSGIELIAVITLAAQQILAGDGFSVGMLVALLSYRGYFTERLRSCVDLLAQVYLLRVHLQRLADIWLESPEVDSGGVAPAAHTATAPQAVTLRGVGFRYGPQAAYLFRDLNLTVAPGEFVAIVGVSGAGKSTLLRVLMGLLAPVEGEIRVGPQCLQAHNAHDFRARCACVLQEDTFFSGSLADNICLFEPVDTARLDAVLQQVGLQQDVASLPMGVRSTIGDIGSQFSSGQMQRLWLARALYRQPDYLFLDEGTANLDADSTAAIAQQLAGLTCTRIAITHNMALAARADRVLLLQNGQLAEIDLSRQQVSAG